MNKRSKEKKYCLEFQISGGFYGYVSLVLKNWTTYILNNSEKKVNRQMEKEEKWETGETEEERNRSPHSGESLLEFMREPNEKQVSP